MRSNTPTNSPSAPPRRSPATPTCRPRRWCASPRRSGFGGFSDLQEVFRSHLRNRWPDYSERLKALHETARDSGDPIDLLMGFANSAASSVARLREVDRPARLDRAIDLLARAKTIYCLGQRRSFSVAHYLSYALAQLGLSATLIDNVGGLGPEQLARAGPRGRADRDQLLSLFAGHRRPRQARAAGAHPDRRRHRQRALPARRPRRRPLRDRRKRLRLVPLAGATFCLAMTLAVAVAERRAAGEELLLGESEIRQESGSPRRGRRQNSALSAMR